MKIENLNRKRSHKLEGFGVGRIKTFPFLTTPFPTCHLWYSENRLWESEAEAEEPTNHNALNRALWLVNSVTPALQFSLIVYCKRRSHKRKRCFASDSVGLIFTRSYGSTLWITPPTTISSLVQASLKIFFVHSFPCSYSVTFYANFVKVPRNFWCTRTNENPNTLFTF